MSNFYWRIHINAEEPDFFEPKPISPKRNSNILFADNTGNIHMTFEEQPIKKPIKIKRRNLSLNDTPSVLGKRKLVDAFGFEIYYDIERYGQEIPSDFFKINIGHGVLGVNK